MEIEMEFIMLYDFSPSGTENIVRVYAEASTEEKAKELADVVAKEVGRIAADHK